MENTKNTNTPAAGSSTEGSKATTQPNTGNGTSANPADETVTMSKADYDKAIQSAEDRVRTKYTKEIKDLKDKVNALTPPVKTDKELAIEQRLAELERKEREAEAKAKELQLKSSLQSHNIDVGLAGYLQPDVDAEAFSADIEKVITARMASSGYKPTGHQTNQPISKADYDKMTYDERVALYDRDHDTWERIRK